LIKLQYYTQNAFLLRQQLVSVFFDLEETFDTTWLHGILRTLTAGISGVDGHYFFLISSGPITSASDLQMCHLRVILKKMECQKDEF
jgi:hypothetical protein